MKKMDWSRVVVGSLMGVIMTACTATPSMNAGTAANETSTGTARKFDGTIVSFRPLTSTMLISKDEYHGNDRFPNIVQVKYTPDTQFLVDRRPATLTDIQQYMNVTIAGHMQDGHLIVETANFSTLLPKNVIPAAQASDR